MNFSKSVDREDEGIKLEDFLVQMFPDLHRGALRQLVQEGQVRVNGRTCGRSITLRAEALVEVEMPAGESLRPRKRARADQPRILWSDDHCLVVDKPPGVPVIPERYRQVDTVRDLLPQGEELRVVHRIDRDTSGCLVLARTLEGMQQLERQFSNREVKKVYLALVRGNTTWGVQRAEGAIGPSQRRGTHRMRVVSQEERLKHPKRPCKEALTEFRVVRSFRGYSLVEARPLTGRTHQVRVHLASRGLPLVGDELYNRGVERGLFLSEFKSGYRPKPGREERPLLGRLALHAAAITFRSPAGGEQVRVEAPLPADMARALDRLTHYLGGDDDPAGEPEGAK